MKSFCCGTIHQFKYTLELYLQFFLYCASQSPARFFVFLICIAFIPVVSILFAFLWATDNRVLNRYGLYCLILEDRIFKLMKFEDYRNLGWEFWLKEMNRIKRARILEAAYLVFVSPCVFSLIFAIFILKVDRYSDVYIYFVVLIAAFSAFLFFMIWLFALHSWSADEMGAVSAQQVGSNAQDGRHDNE